MKNRLTPENSLSKPPIHQHDRIIIKLTTHEAANKGLALVQHRHQGESTIVRMG